MTGVLVPLSEMNTNVVILRAESTIADIDLRGPHKQGNLSLRHTDKDSLWLLTFSI